MMTSIVVVYMAIVSSQIIEYVQLYREGRRDDAFFGLLEMDHDMMPELTGAFRAESDVTTRAFLVEVIWQHRRQDVIPFLGEALQSSEPVIWKQAIDGLVALASPAALEVLLSARQSGTDEFRSWLEEAIEQTQEQMGTNNRRS